MPLKYKKLVVFFSLGILLIGLGTFAIISPDFHFSFHRQTSDNPARVASFGAIQTLEGKSETDIRQELNSLVERYYSAKQQVDMNTIASCVSNVGHIDEKKLMTEAEYVEGYQDIHCKILDGADNSSYRVYVYYYVKIYDIDTLIPSLNALYIKQMDDGSFKIYLDTLKSREQKYIDSLDQSKPVRELVTTVQKELRTVVSRDSEVRECAEKRFYQITSTPFIEHREAANRDVMISGYQQI